MTTYFLAGYMIFVLVYSMYLHKQLDLSFLDAMYYTLLAWPVFLLFGIDQMTRSFHGLFKKRKTEE